MLLLLMPTLLMAQNGVEITNFYARANGAATTLIFNVQWMNNHPAEFVWSDTVWVFVDYNRAGTMTRL
jgi:hypothetical protein